MLVLMLLFTLTVFVVAGCSGGATKEGANEAGHAAEENAEGAAEKKAEGEAAEEGHGEESPIATQRDAQLETTKDIKDSSVLYNDACGPCHGADGHGVVGPALKGTALTYEQVKAMIEVGRGGMPKFKGTELTDEQIDIIANYVKKDLK